MRLVASVLAGAALLATVTAHIAASAQATPVPGAGAQGPAPAPRGAMPRSPVAATPRSETRPFWAELPQQQQQALRPLAPSWNTLSEAQKRKWIALSRNYGNMAPAEQAKLHSRMNEWVALSPQQRIQARLNFAETKSLSPDDKKAKWEAYQALSPEEKRKLAAGAGNARTPPTAAAVKPLPPQKLANVPRPARGDTHHPRITTGPMADARPAQQPPQPAAVPPVRTN